MNSDIDNVRIVIISYKISNLDRPQTEENKVKENKVEYIIIHLKGKKNFENGM